MGVTVIAITLFGVKLDVTDENAELLASLITDDEEQREDIIACPDFSIPVELDSGIYLQQINDNGRNSKWYIYISKFMSTEEDENEYIVVTPPRKARKDKFLTWLSEHDIKGQYKQYLVLQVV